MIQTGYQVPSNYYIRSRDFQLLGRVFDIVFNSSKTYSDMIAHNAICNNTDKTLLELIARTIGFDPVRKYDVQDLYTVCTSFKYIISRKGTLESIKDCVRALLNAQNIAEGFDVEELYDINGNKLYELQIIVPTKLKDRVLLVDLLEYVLPTGYTYNIINSDLPDVGFKSHDAVVRMTQPITAEYVDTELGHVYGGTIEDKVKTELTTVYSNPEEE